MAELQTGVQKHPKVILVQEPYFAKRQTPKAPQGFNIYYSQGTTPRAIILVSRSLTSIGLDHLSTRDTVLVQVTAGQEDFFVCSSYLDITVPHVVYDVDECVDHAHRTKLPIIIGMDSNCHSELWGCPNSNPRGEVLEEFIFNKNLILHNQGNKPTFMGAVGSSIIDLILSSTSLVDKILSWQVLDEDYMSGHKMITFQLQVDNTSPQVFYRD